MAGADAALRDRRDTEGEEPSMPDEPTPSPDEREELLLFSARRWRAELEKWSPGRYRDDEDERLAFVEGFGFGLTFSLNFLAFSVAREPLRVPDSGDPDEIHEAFAARVFAVLAQMEKNEADWTLEMLLNDKEEDEE